MTGPAAEWRRASLPESAARLVASGLPEWESALLARRGIETPEEARIFLQPALEHLHDPHRMPGLTAAVERLEAALERGERVAVVGDYDVDGVSATALLAAVLGACGLEVEAILPHRLTEGYGFQPVHVERARLAGCGLIVTADCGTASFEAAAAARAAEIDVVVTDHHLLAGEPPPGIVLVNPQTAPGDYPYLELCGAGLAFKLVAALAARRGMDLDPRRLLAIAALGTICDLVPLTGENRVIAALGLAALGETRSPGLQALYRVSRVGPAVTATDVGYRIGPRLNAAGRLADPEQALELLLTRDPERAERLAEALDGLNSHRQSEERRVVEEAGERFRALPELPPILVAWDESWHKGVVGIAAGRIAQELHRPTILLCLEGDRATGSGRSIRGIHLHGFVSAWAGQLERFGGHAQAIGLTAASDRLEALRAAWESAAASWDPELFVPRFRYDAELELAAVDRRFIEELGRLEPCGQGNPRPLFRFGPLERAAPPRYFGKGHVSQLARDASGGRLEITAWGWGERWQALGGRFEVLARCEIDRYWDRPALRLVDARPVGAADDPPTAALGRGSGEA